jgi:hypothetical protein
MPPIIYNDKTFYDQSIVMPVLFDVTGDGIQDIFLTKGYPPDPGYEGSGTNNSGDAWCLNGATGAVVWHYCPVPGIGNHAISCIHDLDGDGDMEMLITGYHLTVALHAQNGSILWSEYDGVHRHDKPAVVLKSEGIIYVYTCKDSYGAPGGLVKRLGSNGVIVAQATAPIYHPCYGGLSAADINNDGEIEILLGDRSSGVGLSCFASSDLSLIWDYPSVACSTQTPCILDIDGDGGLDVIVNDQSTGKIFAVDGATQEPLWTSEKGSWPWSGDIFMSAIYDVDKDNHLEDINCDQGGPTPMYVYDLTTGALDATLYRSDGLGLPFPPIVANVYGDSDMEFINQYAYEGVDVWDSTYSLVAVAPTDGSHWTISLCMTVIDMDNDGYNEIISLCHKDDTGYCTFATVQVIQTTGLVSSPKATAKDFGYTYKRSLVSQYVAYDDPDNTTNYPPCVPGSPFPANGSTGVSVTVDLSWSCSDPDGNPLTYDVYFGTVNPPPKVAWNVSSSMYDLGTRNPGTTYYWRIVAWDNHGASTRGPVWHYKTNSLPGVPGSPFPANGSTGVPVIADLSWSCSDPDGNPLTYDVYFGTVNPPPKVTGNVSTAMYDPGTMNIGTTYYWKITAWDNHSTSKRGPLWHFKTNTPPITPRSPNPPNSSTGISKTADLSWTCSDPDGNPLTYDVYFGTSSSPPKVASNQTHTSYDPGTMNTGTTYYWKVRTWDNHSTSARGPLWHFKTNTPPITPSSPNPTNSSTGISKTADLSWTCSDPDGNQLTYDVYFGTANPPPKVTGNVSTAMYDPGTMNIGTTYYWKITAWDNHSTSKRGPLWHFKTNSPPNTPSNQNPTNSSTGTSTNADLTWTCTDPNNDPLKYDIYFGTTSSPPKVVSNQTSTTYDPGTMSYSTKYFWKIVAWDNHSASTSGPKWSFTIQTNSSWWNLQWMYRKKITINHTKVTNTLVDFPLLIHITDPDLASKAQTNGYDFVFTNKTGIKLNHEIEYYNSATGELVSWVKMPVLSSSQDTIVYLYYGNQNCSNQENIENTWDSNYLAVQHFDETSGAAYDSTSHHNDGTPYGIPDQDHTGKIDGADFFDGINDHFILPQVFSTQSQFTMEAWIYPQTGARYFISQWSYSQGHGVFLQVGYNPDHIEWYINGNSGNITGITFNTWYHIVLTYDGTTARLYRNAGTPTSKVCAAPTWPAQGLYIGDRSAGSRQFHGMIDEVRLSNIARSSAWISTEYNNQNGPSGFYSVSAEEHMLKSWQFRKKIVINHTKISGNLTNFPIMIHTTDSDLSMKAQSTGGDICFTDDNGVQLNHEVESYNSSSGTLVAWVKIPVLSKTVDTTLYIYYGNTNAGDQENVTGTWDSNFLAVHHLDEISGTVYDSTSQNNDGIPSGNPNQNIQGRIDGADYFDGANDHITLPRVFSTETKFTLEAWIYPQTGARYFISQFSGSQGVFLQVGATPDHLEWYINSNSGSISGITFNTWYHIVLTYDGTTARLYRNAGTPTSKVCNAPTWPAQGVYIGDRSAGSRQFHGIIDEVRLSNIARSSAWISTEYTNQNNPSGFYNVGNEENT